MIKMDSFNVTQAIEDFLKVEYTDGLTNEFNTMDALINKFPKEQLRGKYKTKTFALGVTDNIRALGKSNDQYILGASDYTNGTDTVEAQFDTTKLLGVFAITDEAIVKGTTDGSIFNVLQDSLQRMQLGLKHTINRYGYGSASGKIGVVSSQEDYVADFLGSGSKMYELKITNSHSLLPGMGLLLKKDANNYVTARIFDKPTASVHNESVRIVKIDAESAGTVNFASDVVTVYARQLDPSAAVKAEYTGLEDIVMTQNNEIFGVDRAVYKALNSTVQDLAGSMITEERLRDMTDHIELSNSDGSQINLLASNHRIVSSIEKQMYQFKQYDMDASKGEFGLGRPTIKFDNYVLFKDKYARDANIYMLDTRKIGELMRKDFGWLTKGGAAGILERRDGSEIYEGIMTKYADMYIDSFKSHAAFKNVAVEATEDTQEVLGIYTVRLTTNVDALDSVAIAGETLVEGTDFAAGVSAAASVAAIVAAYSTTNYTLTASGDTIIMKQKVGSATAPTAVVTGTGVFSSVSTVLAGVAGV